MIRIAYALLVVFMISRVVLVSCVKRDISVCRMGFAPAAESQCLVREILVTKDITSKKLIASVISMDIEIIVA